MSAATPQQPRSGLDVCLLGLFALVFAVLFLMFAWRPLGDPDFWWHLKTGELIVAGRHLLTADPFNFTSDPLAATFLERVILKAYWLWQVVAYGFYQFAGFSGIKLLRALTLAGIYATLGWSMLRNRVRLPVALPLLVTSLFLISKIYRLERPQVLSFWFAALLIVFFLEIRRGERPSPWLYPLMLLWANIHGGVAVGAALLMVFAVGSLWDWRNDRKRLQHIVLWCGGGLLASLVNPNGVEIYKLALGMASSESASAVVEFASPFEGLVDRPRVYVPLLLLLLAHCAALCTTWKRRVATDWLLSFLLVALAAMFMRNLAFVMIALVPLTARFLSEALADRDKVVGRAEKGVALAVIALLAVFSSVDIVKGQLWRRAAWTDIDPVTVPRELARFLDATPLRGNIFNYYGWGGYLLWELHPKYKLFIDGRNLHGNDFFDEYQTILGAGSDTDPEHPGYQKLLDKYKIDYVVMPHQSYLGHVQPLLKFLLTDRNWQPIYQDGSGFVLARYKAETMNVIRQNALDKVAFLDRLLTYYTAKVREDPENANHYLGRGELLGYMGRYAEAEQDFAKVRQLDPDHEYLEGKVRQLQMIRETE